MTDESKVPEPPLSPEYQSWLDIPENSDFSLLNIPFGIFSPNESHQGRRCATIVGDTVVDLSILEEAGCFDGIIVSAEDDDPDTNVAVVPANLFRGQTTLNAFVGQSPAVWKAVRRRLQALFRKPSDDSAIATNNRLFSNRALQKAAFYSVDSVQLHMPLQVGDYTDFYSSQEHATNVGIMFRGKDNALQPNWKHLPVGYHGRSSTLQISGEPVRRPCGQLQKDPKDASQGSVYGACQKLDFELEVATVLGGASNAPGTALTLHEAKERIFGFTLMNDWSARDIQTWEYVPLGPFTSKNWATSISPWIVTTLALEEGSHACPTSAVSQDDPVPLPYLQDPNYSSYNIHLEIQLQSSNMDHPTTICHSNLQHLYWNAAQQLVHHSVAGCVMNAGDLLGSGTISGSSEDPPSFGSMLELSWNGTKTVTLTDTEERTFLRDGDTVILKGHSPPKIDTEGRHIPRIGFGSCESQIQAAAPFEQTQGQPSQPKKAKVSPSNNMPHERYQHFKLYGFYKSSSTWRVRVALAAKGIEYETVPINIFAGEQNASWYLEKVNSLGQVPVLEFNDMQSPQVNTGEGNRATTIQLSQSIAILEFLDAAFPQRRSLFPKDPLDKALAYQMVEVINSGTQPLQNMSFLKKIQADSEERILADDLAKRVIEKGLGALERLVVGHSNKQQGPNNVHITHGPYSLGTFSPSVVEAVLVPQMANAKRLDVNFDAICPTLKGIDALCADHPWFQTSHPDRQPDAGT